MTAITKRELSAYFASPIGFIFLAVFYAFAGFYFFATTLAGNTADLSGVYNNLFTIVLFLIPILTMRLFSEERKNRTDQALLTAPVSLIGLVLGKFFASVLVFLMGLGMTLVYALVVSVFAAPNWALVFGNFIALLLLGMALIAIGMFISALTESQVVAAVGAFAVGLFIMMMDSLSSIFSSTILTTLVNALSFMQRYDKFTTGIFDLSGVVYFLTVSAVFIFLTIRVQEKRRWN